MEWHYITTPILLLVFYSGIYRFGVLTKPDYSFGYDGDCEDFLFYDCEGKGKLLGKTLFSIPFALATMFPIIIGYQSVDVWIIAVLISFFIISTFELYKSVKDSSMYEIVYADITKMSIFLFYVAITFFGLIISPLLFLIDPNLILTIVAIAVATDICVNMFGKILAYLPENYQAWRLRYPESISSNKSFMAVLMALGVLVEVTIFFDKEYIPLTTFVVFGTVFGDAFFSVYKRLMEKDDFFPTLGPIGGLLDRIDGWIFAYIFGSYSSIFYTL